MLCRRLPLLSLSFPPRPIPKPNLQIRPRAKHPPLSRNHDTPDPLVHIKHGICRLDLATHRVGEGIVFVRAVQGEDHDGGFGRVGVRADGLPGGVEGGVGFWEGDWGVTWGAGGHCGGGSGGGVVVIVVVDGLGWLREIWIFLPVVE